GADGEAAAEALGHADGVGAHTGVLKGEELAGATDAALHLVEHEQEVVLVAERAQALQKLGGGRIDAALALNGLDEDRGGLVVDQRLEGGEVVELAEREAGHEGTETLLDFFLRGRAHAAEGATVEGAFGADDFVALALFAAGLAHAVEPGELEQAFVGLGTAVAKEDAAGSGAADETAGEFALVGVAKEVADVDQ